MKKIDSLSVNCTGCECCFNVCPSKAISLAYDEEGFLFPSINNVKCIDCGICYNTCPQNKQYITSSQSYYGFSKWNGSLSCSSGGVITYLSQVIVKNGGYVCGCLFDESFSAKHIVTNKLEDLERMKSSKYVQSTLGDCFCEIKKLLDLDAVVLFIGTPCQVAGLKSFLRKDYSTFYSIDLVCHGVPSPVLFKLYKKWLEKRNRSSLSYYNFRFKKNGLCGHTVKYSFQNNKTFVLPRELDIYDLDYKKRVNYRQSCYTCRYSNLKSRVGDLTVGDFWGLEPNNPNNDKHGVSSIISNSNKGKKLLQTIESQCLFETTKESVLEKQDALNGSSIRPKERDAYYEHLDESFFDRKKEPKKVIYYIKRFVPNGLKRIIKRLFKK